MLVVHKRSAVESPLLRNTNQFFATAENDSFPPTLSNAAIARFMIMTVRFGLRPVMRHLFALMTALDRTGRRGDVAFKNGLPHGRL